MRRIGVGIGAWLALGGTAHATDHFVDVDGGACAAAGTEADPYSTLQCAIDGAALAAGDRILLGDGVHDGATTSGQTSGTASAPISIEPRPGAGPRLAGGIVLDGVDHWRVAGLTFEGGSGGAIELREGTGLIAEGNDILDWAGPGIVAGAPGTSAPGVIIRNNRVEGTEHVGIYVENADDARVEDNDITAVRCTSVAFSLCVDCGGCFGCGDCLATPAADCTIMQSFELGGRLGIRVLGTASNVEVARNYIHDFESEGCGLDGTRNAGVWVTGGGVGQGSVHHNWIARVGPDSEGYGVLMFQSSPDWVIERNLIESVGGCGLCEGDFLFFGGAGTRWEHNTIIDADYGVDVRATSGARFDRNLVAAARVAAVRVQDDGIAEPPQLTANVYDAASVGVWGAQTTGELSAWQRACACDADARQGAPEFEPGGHTPAPDGPAADLPATKGAFHGAGPDAGALEAVLATSASISEEAPARVAVALENRVAPPLSGLEVCAGITVEVDGAAVPLRGCALATDEVLHVELVDGVFGESSVRLRHAAAGIVDDSRIGGRVGARLADADLEVDNGAPLGPPGPATDSGTVDHASTGAGDESGSEGNGAAGDGGCACGHRSRGPAGALDLQWLLLGLVLPFALRRAESSR